MKNKAIWKKEVFLLLIFFTLSISCKKEDLKLLHNSKDKGSKKTFRLTFLGEINEWV